MEGLKRHKADRRHPLELCVSPLCPCSQDPLTALRARSLCSLNEELDAFVTWIRPTNAEHELRLQAFRCFESLVKSVWPFATCELFGSMATGLYLPDGCAAWFFVLPS
jgi:DNA polymerase sigma